ncbi:hypothetical protein [Ilumatobacter sp.]|uniref:hypothetical protein n=1 Tax=Ilumatobacter sp. TaxID=1967498 RepID=UPI003AF82189
MTDVGDSENRRRTIVRRVVFVLSALSLVLGGFAAYSRDALFDSREFSELAAEAAEHENVRPAIAAAIVDQIVAADAELLSVRPLIEIVVEGVMTTTVFHEIFTFGVADLHRTIFTDASDTTTVGLAEMMLAVKSNLAKIDPDLAALIPDELTDGIIELTTSEPIVDTVQIAETASLLGFVLPLLALAGFALYVWLSTDRRRALVSVGLAGVFAGVVMLVVTEFVLFLLVRSLDDDASDTVTAVWNVMTRGAGDIALWLVAGGAVVAAAATWTRDSATMRARIDGAVDALRPPESPGGRIVWGLGGIVLGVLMVTNGTEVLLLAAAAVGVALITIGLAVAVRGVVGDRIVDSVVSTANGDDRSNRSRVAWVLVASAAFLVTVVALFAIARSGGDDVRAADGPGCNGSVLLCGRTLDRVAFAATHNSMAAANDGFTAGYQTVGMVPQLDDGYRGFLIDAYFGIESGDVVFTDRAPVTPEERDQLVQDVGESAVSSAEALRESMQVGGGERSVYLCHSFCEIGAVSMVDEMSRIKRWLDAHPRDVVIFVIQDEGPTEEDIGEVFEASGLDDYLHSQPIDEPWPTLSELIDSGRRLWVSAENAGNDDGWYHSAFTYMQDTPFSQPSVEEFTCEPNRGETESPMLLVNHWLSPASPTSADEANSRAVVEARLEQCESEREMFVNLFAVDFSDRGDVLEVIAEYNGVRSG